MLCVHFGWRLFEEYCWVIFGAQEKVEVESKMYGDVIFYLEVWCVVREKRKCSRVG